MFFYKKKKKLVEKTGPVTPITWQPLPESKKPEPQDEPDYQERNKDLARQLSAIRS